MSLRTKHRLLGSVTRNFSSALGHPGIYSQKVLQSRSEAELEILANVFDRVVSSVFIEMVTVLIYPPFKFFKIWQPFRQPVLLSPFSDVLFMFTPHNPHDFQGFSFSPRTHLYYIKHNKYLPFQQPPLDLLWSLNPNAPKLDIYISPAPPARRELRAGFQGCGPSQSSPASCFSIAMEMQLGGGASSKRRKSPSWVELLTKHTVSVTGCWGGVLGRGAGVFLSSLQSDYR